MIDTHLLVVGGGPIGIAVALRMAIDFPKLQVILIDSNGLDLSRINSRHISGDKSADSRQIDDIDTKVFALNGSSISLLKELGAWARLREQRLLPYSDMHVWDSKGTGSVSFHARDIDAEYLGYILEASELLRALFAVAVETQNLRLIESATLTQIDQLDDKNIVDIELQLKNGSTSKELIAADLIIAADGGRSKVRELCEIDYAEEDCGQRALVANIEIEKAHQNCAWQIFLPSGPLAFLPLFDQNQKLVSIVWSLTTEKAAAIEEMGKEDISEAIAKASEFRFGNCNLISPVQSFPLRQLHSHQYFRNGIVLLGDAAHNIHPLAGLGANLGFKDVQVLSQELLRASRRGLSFRDDKVLSRYQRGRRLDAELVIKLMSAFRNGFSDHGLQINAVRNLGMKIFDSSSLLKKQIIEAAFMSN